MILEFHFNFFVVGVPSPYGGNYVLVGWGGVGWGGG